MLDRESEQRKDNQSTENYSDRPENQDKTYTIQQTSKAYKGMTLLGCLGLISGFFCLFIAPAFGVSILVLGLSLFLFGNLLAWWHHG